MDEEEARRFQEEQDAEVARLLGDQELKRRGDCLPQDQLMAIQAQDQELAKVLQEQERAKAKKAREKARQKALQKKQLKRQRQEERRPSRQQHRQEQQAAEVGGGEGSASFVVAAEVHNPCFPPCQGIPDPMLGIPDSFPCISGSSGVRGISAGIPGSSAIPLSSPSNNSPGSRPPLSPENLLNEPRISETSNRDNESDSRQQEPHNLLHESVNSHHEPHNLLPESANRQQQPYSQTANKDYRLNALESPRYALRPHRAGVSERSCHKSDVGGTSPSSKLNQNKNHMPLFDSRQYDLEHPQSPNDIRQIHDKSHPSHNDSRRVLDEFRRSHNESRQSHNESRQSDYESHQSHHESRQSHNESRRSHNVSRQPNESLQSLDVSCTSRYESRQSLTHTPISQEDAYELLSDPHHSHNSAAKTTSYHSPLPMSDESSRRREDDPRHRNSYQSPRLSSSPAGSSQLPDDNSRVLDARHDNDFLLSSYTPPLVRADSDHLYDTPADDLFTRSRSPSSEQNSSAATLKSTAHLRNAGKLNPSERGSASLQESSVAQIFNDVVEPYASQPIVLPRTVAPRSVPLPRIPSPPSSHNTTQDSSFDDLGHHYDTPSLLLANHYDSSSNPPAPQPRLTSPTYSKSPQPSVDSQALLEYNRARSTTISPENFDSRRYSGSSSTSPRVPAALNQNFPIVSQSGMSSFDGDFDGSECMTNSHRPITENMTSTHSVHRPTSPFRISPYLESSSRDVTSRQSSPRGMISDRPSANKISPTGAPSSSSSRDCVRSPDISHTPDAKHALGRPRSMAEVMQQLQLSPQDRRTSVGALLDDQLPPYQETAGLSSTEPSHSSPALPCPSSSSSSTSSHTSEGAVTNAPNSHPLAQHRPMTHQHQLLHQQHKHQQHVLAHNQQNPALQPHMTHQQQHQQHVAQQQLMIHQQHVAHQQHVHQQHMTHQLHMSHHPHLTVEQNAVTQREQLIHRHRHQFNIACAIDPTYQRRVMDGDLPAMQVPPPIRHHHHHPPHLLHHHHTHHHHPDHHQQQVVLMQQQQFELQQEDEQRRQQLFLLQQKQQQAQNQAVLRNHELQQRPYQGQLQQRMFVQQQPQQLAPQIDTPESPAPPYMPIQGQRRSFERAAPRLAELQGAAAVEDASPKLRLGKNAGKQSAGCKQQ
ncbi:myb-like protein Q [Hyalella azteca]|uniref:Myb-like protein Q n=1 Tax=Hyalella azteca TaxID=294128 RepID=A0A8B7PM73_HYAAZ|nr:myb-like protein Q [Hyalella azteca]